RAWARATPTVPSTPAGSTETEDLTVSVPRMRALETTASEQREMLRRVFLEGATPVRLAEVLDGLDFPPGTPAIELPPRGRSVAVLADPAGGDAAEPLAIDLRSPVVRPTEFVVPSTASRLPGIQRLRTEGVPVRTARFTT